MRLPLTLTAIIAASTFAVLPASAGPCGHQGHASHHHSAAIYVQPDMNPNHSHVTIINAPHHGARPASAESGVRVFRPASAIDSRAAAIQARLNTRAQRAEAKALAQAKRRAQAHAATDTALRLARIEANQDILIEQNLRRERLSQRRNYRTRRSYNGFPRSRYPLR